MEDRECKTHGVAKTVYCADCRTVGCPKCPPSGQCKADHKKAEVSLAAVQVQETRDKEIGEMVHLFTEVIQMENKIEKSSKRLEELKNQHYADVFMALQNIQERIESLNGNKDKLPNQVHACQELVSQLKSTFVEKLTLAKMQVQETRRALQAGDCFAVLAAPRLEPINVSEMYKFYIELQFEVKEFFQSLEAFQDAFSEASVVHEPPRIDRAERGVQTDLEPSGDLSPGKELPPKHSVNEELRDTFKAAFDQMAQAPRQSTEELQRTLKEVLGRMAETPKQNSEDLKLALKEILEQITRSNQQFYEQARSSLQEVAAAIKQSSAERRSEVPVPSEDPRTTFETQFQTFQEKMQKEISAMLAQREKSIPSPPPLVPLAPTSEPASAETSGRLGGEQVAERIDSSKAELNRRIAQLEEQLKAVRSSVDSSSNRGYSPSADGRRETGLAVAVPPEEVAERSGKPKGEAKEFAGLHLKFASYLNVAGITEVLQRVPGGSIVYVLGSKNGIGPADLASLFNMMDLAQSIQSVSLEHIYFKDMLPFAVLMKNATRLQTLELLSCPFVAVQIQQIIERIVQAGSKIERLVIENSLISDQLEELVKAINKTKIKHIKISNPKIRLSKFVEVCRALLADSIEVIDFGVIPSDPSATEMLNEWKTRKNVLFEIESDSATMRKTYKY